MFLLQTIILNKRGTEMRKKIYKPSVLNVVENNFTSNIKYTINLAAIILIRNLIKLHMLKITWCKYLVNTALRLSYSWAFNK